MENTHLLVQMAFPACNSSDTQKRIHIIVEKIILLRDVTWHQVRPHYIWVTGVMPRSFIPLAKTERAAWKRQSRAWKTRKSSHFWVVLQNRVWFLGQQLDTRVRTPCAACPLHSRLPLGLGSTQNLSTKEHKALPDSHQLLAAHCTVNRGTLSNKGRWRGMSSPALEAEQAKMPEQECND